MLAIHIIAQSIITKNNVEFMDVINPKILICRTRVLLRK